MSETLATRQGQFIFALYDPQALPIACDDPKGFEIYRRNLWLGLEAVLAEVFSVTRTLLGCAPFAAYADSFIRQTPQTTGDRTLYGAGFADFLRRHPALTDYGVIADMAAYEWALHRLHHAPDRPTLGFGDLIDPEITVGLAPETCLLRLTHNAEALHSLHVDGGDPDRFDLEASDRTVLLWRTPEDAVVRRPLTDIEARFLTALRAGADLATLLTDMPDPTPLQHLLAETVPQGLFIHLKD